EEMAVVEGPDAVGVTGVLEEDVRPQPLHGVRDLPRETVEEEVAGVRQEPVPEVEEEGGPRILEAPGPRNGIGGLGGDQGAGGVLVGGEAAAIEPLALGPAPVAMSGLPLRGGLLKHPAVEAEEGEILEVAGGVARVGGEELPAHVDTGRGEPGGD